MDRFVSPGVVMLAWLFFVHYSREALNKKRVDKQLCTWAVGGTFGPFNPGKSLP